jgi:hypothetical protein
MNFKRETMRIRKLRLTVLIAVAGGVVCLAAGCSNKAGVRGVVDAKDLVKPSDTRSLVDPSTYVAKSDFEGKTFYLVRGVEEADSRNPLGAVPGYYLGGWSNMAIVRGRVTEDSLRFEAVSDSLNRDETAAVVASFPIRDHFDIKRDGGDSNAQSGRLIEDRDQPALKRSYMRVDFANPTNSWGRIAKALGADEVREEDVRLLENPTTDRGTISWLAETHLKTDTDFKWIALNDTAPVPAFKIVYRTYLMPVEARDFERSEFTPEDSARFGYFTTQLNARDPERGLRDSGIKTFVNKFNLCEKGRLENGKPARCSTNKITWHLNQGFPEKYLEAARLAVAEWNETFKQALGRDDDVIVLDERTRVDRVDPRYNIIAHYGPDNADGPFGIAQAVKDPVTGEIISARANVYEMGMREILAEVDDTIDMLSTSAVKSVIYDASEATNSVPPGARNKNQASLGASALTSSALKPSELGESIRRRFVDIEGREPLGAQHELFKRHPELFQYPAVVGLESSDKARTKAADGHVRSMIEQVMTIGEHIRDEKQKIFDISSGSSRGAEAFGVHGAELVDEAVQNYLMNLAKTKSVDEIAKNRGQIKAEIDKRVFYMTLLHEMGHCFGLRHNFAGSVDKAHYNRKYFEILSLVQAGRAKAEELDPYKFSSVMDYVADLGVWSGGTSPYDLAAIRFAYNRSIDRENDVVINGQGLPFKFCTDEDVGEDPLCNRGDKGANLSEVTANRIAAYERNFMRTHYRRDRAQFEKLAGRYGKKILEDTFIPLRKVMDEFNFALANPKAERVAEKDRGNGKCDLKFMRVSIDKGEVANVCNPLEAERGGVDVNDYGTFFLGLIATSQDKSGSTIDRGIFRRHMSEYEPLRLADLIFSNHLAQSFFADLLSAAEPGLYLAVAPAPGKPSGAYELVPLPEEGRTVEERLRILGAQQEETDLERFVTKARDFIVELRVGRYAKALASDYSSVGPARKLMRLGAAIDKMMAIEALSLRDIGARKYRDVGLTGNAYTFPQSRTFTTELFTNLISGTSVFSMPKLKGILRPDIAVVTLSSGRRVAAYKNSSLGLGIQALAVNTALTEMVFDGDQSMLDRLRVCSMGDQNCINAFGAKTVEYTTASGHDRWRAVQTQDGDSITFAMVERAKAIDDERKVWLDLQAKADDRQIDAVMKIDEAIELRDRLDAALTALPELRELRESLLGERGVWNTMKDLTSSLKSVGTFEVSEKVREMTRVLLASVSRVDDLVKAIDETKSEAAVRHQALLTVKKELTAVRAVIEPVLRADRDAKLAPLLIKKLTGEIAEIEAKLAYIRKVKKANGWE